MYLKIARCLSTRAWGTLDFIRPDKFAENAVIESCNGRFHDECLNADVFVSLHDMRQKRIEA